MVEYNAKSHLASALRAAENQGFSAYQPTSKDGNWHKKPTNVALSKLKLNNFRNYQKINFDFDADIIVITGNNGAGKTNILEAITLFSKGRGLRSSEFDEMIQINATQDGFTLYGEIHNHPRLTNIGTSYSKKNNKRLFCVDGKNLDNIKYYPTIIWLTPQMEGLLLAPKNLRRKFLDRIASDIDSGHNSRINSYDKLLKERINLLIKYGSKNEDKWLNIVERKIAELGSAIAISRNEAIEYLNRAILLNKSDFIKTRIEIIGELEEMALKNNAIFIEEKFAQKLKENRNIDGKSCRTSFGVHRSEFTAILLNKNLEAKFCSTGEQKSILIALTFARIEIFSFLGLPSAILLLDEIASHLDDNKKLELFKEIDRLGVQCFLTGVSQEIFADLKNYSSKIIRFINMENF